MAGILIIAPHADDEVLGCGGIISRSRDEKHWLVCAKEDKPYAQVSDFFKFTSTRFLDLPDGRFDECKFGDIVEGISKAVHELKPSVVFMPFYKDIHSDHRVIAEAVLSVCKPFRTPFVKSLLMYETLSQTNMAIEPFIPNYFVDITGHLERKQAAARLYGIEMLEGARSSLEIGALAIYRGSFISVRHAEAFQVVRMSV